MVRSPPGRRPRPQACPNRPGIASTAAGRPRAASRAAGADPRTGGPCAVRWNGSRHPASKPCSAHVPDRDSRGLRRYTCYSRRRGCRRPQHHRVGSRNRGRHRRLRLACGRAPRTKARPADRTTGRQARRAHGPCGGSAPVRRARNQRPGRRASRAHGKDRRLAQGGHRPPGRLARAASTGSACSGSPARPRECARHAGLAVCTAAGRSAGNGPGARRAFGGGGRALGLTIVLSAGGRLSGERYP